MIFTSVSNLKNSIDKTIFIEHIELYIKLVNAFCEKNRIDNLMDEKIINLKELQEIGVIQAESEIPLLKKILTKR